jgi:hypothetical protein
MKMKKRFLLIVALAVSIASFSQNIVRVIVDSRTRFPIDYVAVNSDDKKINLLSTKDGKVMLVKDSKVKSYTFYKMGYEPLSLTVDEIVKKDSIFMKEKFVNLIEISVTSHKLDTVFKNKRCYVNDYLALPNDNFLLITSILNVKGFELAYYNREKGIMQRKKFRNEDGESLFVDCFKNVHLLTNDFSRQIFFDSDSSFDFLPKYARMKFDSTLAKTVLNLDSAVIIKTSRPPMEVQGEYFNTQMNSPFLTYIKISKGKRSRFYTAVYNKSIREMYKSEIPDEAMTQARMKEASVRGESDQAIESKRDLFFTRIAAPIYAPIYLKNDTVIIFNFQENIIVHLSKNGKVLKEVPIDHKSWSTLHEFEVICDYPRQKFYIRSREFDGSALNRINVYTGEISKKIKLEKPFVHNIQVYNDRIFYLVKEMQWDDTMYLYQQNQ